VETSDGRRAKLYPGDRLACAVGNRYATSLLEGVADVSGEIVHLLSASGICGQVVASNDKTSRATTLRVLGQAMDRGRPMNLRSFALEPAPPSPTAPLWVVVVGSGMDTGKTTAAASLIHGLRASGQLVAAAKITGTASARDVGAFRDAGADPVVDFSDLGWPSTAGCDGATLRDIVIGVTVHLQRADVAVLEVADGLLQPETNLLIRELEGWIGPAQLILTASESMAAVAGAHLLAQLGRDVLAISGVVTNSPLACRELEQAGVGPCIATSALGRELAPLIGRLATTRSHPIAATHH
jgi:hypothetical protein